MPLGEFLCLRSSSAGTFVSTPPFSTTDTIGMSVTPSQFDLLSKMVDVTAARHKILSQNVANVDTPGYRRLSVSFDEMLAAKMDRHGDKTLKYVRPEVFEDETSPDRVDGNNVDIDREMMQINKNTLLNNTFLQVISTKTAMMRRAINGS